MSVKFHDSTLAGVFGACVKAITQEQYDLLSPAEKQADVIYNIIDDRIGNPNVYTKHQTDNLIATRAPLANNAGAHNAIYRGEYLGNSVTNEQWAAINAGTFDGLYIGDYWTIGGVNWRIAAFDYWLNNGDTQCTTHHVVIVPDTTLYAAAMNDTNTTAGAYVGCKMYTTNLATAKTTINNAFGSSHILSHREALTNAISGNVSSGWAWYDSTVELMNEVMVYGSHAFGSAIGFESGSSKSQLPLFILEPSRIINRVDWWLRDVHSAYDFSVVASRGNAAYVGANATPSVRPVFAIKA